VPGIDQRDPRQPYEQIADFIRSEIKAGNLRPGDRVPSGRDLASKFNVAHQTAAHALRALKDEGLIMSWSGRGAFVRDEALETLKAGTDDPDRAFSVIMTRLDEVQSQVSKLTDRVSKLERARRPQGH
jgi:GntR family transcriptional regulator